MYFKMVSLDNNKTPLFRLKMVLSIIVTKYKNANNVQKKNSNMGYYKN